MSLEEVNIAPSINDRLVLFPSVLQSAMLHQAAPMEVFSDRHVMKALVLRIYRGTHATLARNETYKLVNLATKRLATPLHRHFKLIVKSKGGTGGPATVDG